MTVSNATNGKDTRRTRAALGAALLLTLLSGCKAGDLAATAGHYQGILTEKSGAATAQTIVNADIVSGGTFKLEMRVASVESTPRTWDFRIQANARGQVSFVDSASGKSTPLKSSADACYVNSDAATPAAATIRVCYQANQVTLDDASLSFLMSRADPSDMPTMEAPADYKLSELVGRAVSRSFSSQIEFENVVQARLNSESAHLNLVPHFSLGDLMSISSVVSSWTGLVHMIGDLAPFLIPSNWFKARTAGFQSDAEAYGYKLMQADSGNIAAGLGYAVVRDQLSLAKMQDERAKVASIRDDVYYREHLGFLPEGSTDTVDAVLVACDKTILGLHGVIEQELAGLATAAGFFNPAAVRSITIDNDLSIDHPDTFDTNQASQLALSRAAELKQMTFLIDAARNDHTERYFDWLDPSGGGGASIGIGMGAYIALGAAEVQAAVVKRQQVQAQILQTVTTTNDALNDSISAYAIAQRSSQIQDALVNDYLNQIHLGGSVPPSELITAFGGQMQADLDLINARFQYLVSHDNMERVLYLGPYTPLSSLSN